MPIVQKVHPVIAVVSLVITDELKIKQRVIIDQLKNGPLLFISRLNVTSDKSAQFQVLPITVSTSFYGSKSYYNMTI